MPPIEISPDAAIGSVGITGVVDKNYSVFKFSTIRSIKLLDDMPLLYLPRGEESPPLTRGFSDDVGRTGWLVSLPVLLLTLRRTVGNLLAGTALQLVLVVSLTEGAGTNIHIDSLKHKKLVGE